MKTISATQRLVISGDDWGPAVTKTILSFDHPVDGAGLSTDTFTVTETKETTDFSKADFPRVIASFERKVTAVYLSNAAGNPVDDESSSHVTIEMYVSPQEGSPFFYDMKTGLNDWCTPYSLAIEGEVTVDGEEVLLNVKKDIDLKDPASRICPEADRFTFRTYRGKVASYTYGEYVPESDGEKKALVIWLHGAGEGGKDNYITLLGNKVTALVSDEFQALFNGVYVLTPQTPTFWMNDGTNTYVTEENTGESMYGEDLFSLIDAYVRMHEDIDPERIIIGGCSNGGYMTMKMVLDHPDYFYKAYPICEAYYDVAISDEMLEAVKESGTSFWFTYSENDTTVPPEKTAVPTVERMKEMGIEVHESVYPDVHDTTGRFYDDHGNPYDYIGHWSWLYFFNNENNSDGLNEWEWLAESGKDKKKSRALKVVKIAAGVTAGVVLAAGAAIGAAIFFKKKKKF